MKYDLISFFNELFKPIIEEHGILKNNEYIALAKYNNEYKTEEYYNNIYELASECMNKGSYYYNMYFSLSTTNGESRKTKDLRTRTCIAFDFDNREYTHKDILHKFKKIGLRYNILVNSGHGFHAYVLIEPTTDLNLVDKVTKCINARLGADTKATLKTQILRVPNTWNIKEEPKKVKCVWIDENTKRKDINKLARQYCNECYNNTTTNIEYELKKNSTPNCIKEILQKGSNEGNRNTDLQKLVVMLRNINKTLPQVLSIVDEWNTKCSVPMEQRELEYQVNYMYTNLKVCELNCSTCDNKSSCYAKVLSKFEYKEDEKLFNMAECTVSKAKNKKSKRKGVKKMNGNMLLIYSILKNHIDGLYKEEIVEEITYNGEVIGKDEATGKRTKVKINNVALSNPTLIKTLKELEDNGFITVETINRKKFYKLNKERSKEECKFIISFSATYECIKGFISTEEYELYCYMRYLHHKEQRENPNALKGNLFRINQEDLARELGVTQQRISKMINKLIDEKLLSLWYRDKKENSPFFYNTYRLNY